MEDLDFNLIVFNPYRPLAMMLRDIMAQQQGTPAELSQKAWSVLNDSYRCEVNLEHPPHVVALGSLMVAAATMNHDLTEWLAKLNVDMALVRNGMAKRVCYCIFVALHVHLLYVMRIAFAYWYVLGCISGAQMISFLHW